MRYQQLTPLLKELRPNSILEVGTWSGERAIQMMHASKALVYFGFDLFDMATDDDDLAELNVKPHYSAHQVRNKLPFPHQLYQGYSREMLRVFLDQYGPGRVDFAYIDGGHSIETIREDWQLVEQIVKPEGCIVFDDYYPDAPADVLEKFGANKVLEEVQRAGHEIEIWPMTDPVYSYGDEVTIEHHVQMARVL